VRALLIAVGLAVLVGSWGVARYDLTERVAGFDRGLEDISLARGGHVPTEESVREQVEDLAVANRLNVDQVEVSFEPLSADNIHRAGGGAQMASGQADHMASKLMAEQAGSEGVADSLSKAAYDGTLIDVTAQVNAKKWVWSVSEQIEGTTMIRHGKSYAEQE
jgi:hypothetical protein